MSIKNVFVLCTAFATRVKLMNKCLCNVMKVTEIEHHLSDRHLDFQDFENTSFHYGVFFLRLVPMSKWNSILNQTLSRNYSQGSYETVDLYAVWIEEDYQTFVSTLELENKEVEGDNERDGLM